MPRIKLITSVNAPIERCFDLARSVDLHKISMHHSREEIADGIESGLMNLHDTVTWKGTHFGIRFTLQSAITRFSRPFSFTDEMVRGPFKTMVHDHYFYRAGSSTTMVDDFYFQSPWGLPGQLADALILKTYLSRLLAQRNAIIKQHAESDGWKQVLQQASAQNTQG
ncbi:MAG: SRPBCC family protein [Cyclobacteriaceae bacterium]|nr:SRPBCC family protein [Cyclobacteriaceae bacterium]